MVVDGCEETILIDKSSKSISILIWGLNDKNKYMYPNTTVNRRNHKMIMLFLMIMMLVDINMQIHDLMAIALI